MEEDSIMNSSYTQKPVASQEPEESGWTAYFEDFSNNSREHGYCSTFDSSSLVSDAASGAAWKLSHKNHLAACSSIGGSPKIPKKLKFKKSRTKEICQDDSLEDTASSPVNSPKVGDREPTDMNPRKTDHHDHMYSSLGKGSGSEMHREERSMNLNEKNDYTDLKRRGLCLVPLSMLVNYLG
ncbi:hypothetical protein Pint_02056 [Pistacia integerrima]|uniref:Uncharacterized protein n=1 Tax=Pistacia integerrima TaxID=434235 RepID=A0ACC0ZJN0_9ROSI|nr:hypothetical protein Pint_02056 [Pistacia integerrima]